MPRIAVASTDDQTINEHFGKAQRFLIYDVNEQGEHSLLEVRQNQLQAEGGDIQATVEHLLTDVNIVLAGKIGPRALQALTSKGLIGIAVDGPIDKALTACGKRSRVIQQLYGTGFSKRAGGCGDGCSGCR